MRALTRRLRILPNLLRRKQLEAELDQELVSTLDELAAENLARGMSPEEARRRARVELGGLEQVKEAVRDERSGILLEQLAQDARFAARSLRRSRGFALAATLTLALGVGGTTAIWSVLRAALADPDYPAADRLVHVWATWPGGSGNFGFPDFRALVEQNQAFERLAAYENWGGVALTGVERPVMLEPSFVTFDYLPMLGAETELGRTFLPSENRLDAAAPVAVLSHACWQRQFGGDPAIVGRTLRLNGEPTTVVGVLAAGFRDLGPAEHGVAAPDLWLPAASAPRLLGQPPLSDLYSIYWGVGRLRPGVSFDQARENLAETARRMERDQPRARERHGLDLQSLAERTTGAARRPAMLLFAASGLILLLGCVNLANALIVRLGRRQAEMAIRGALGASAGRLARQLLVEAGLLALAGGLAGVALALWWIRLLAGWVRADVATFVEPRFDGAIFAAAAALTVATLVLFGLAPSLLGRRVDLRSALGQAAGRGATDGRARLRRALVVAEVALATVLLVGAGLMGRSVQHLLTQPRGFDPTDLLTLRIDLSGERYADAAARVRFAQALEEKLDAVPGVRSTTLLGPSMLGNATWVMSLFPRDREPASAEDFVQLFRHSVNPGALANLGIPLREGREFDRHDAADQPPVAILSEEVARAFWPGSSAIGRQLRRVDPALPPITVVGVAGDAQHRSRYSLDDIAAGIAPCGISPQRDIYLPYAQRPNPSLTAAIRLAGAPADRGESIRRVTGAIAALDPDLPPSDVAMLADRLAAQERSPAAIAALFAAFAGFALFLAALGLYGVIAQSVEQRAREVGIRLALGARSADILRRFVGGGAALALAGVGLGGLAALAAARAMASLLFGIEPADPATFAAVSVALLAAAIGSSILPVRAVLRRGPTSALREG
ncbi:MAG: ADOP family duplicated permease [Thermoanaerobaculia bacterium]